MVEKVCPKVKPAGGLVADVKLLFSGQTFTQFQYSRIISVGILEKQKSMLASTVDTTGVLQVKCGSPNAREFLFHEQVTCARLRTLL
jgi:hypothetical protein